MLQAMYLVLVTNKASNILEDLETLRLLGKVVADFVMPLEEEVVAAASFDLIFGFDEVVTTGGFKENVTSAQVRQNTEMESHEEKLHKMIIQSKINETKDLMKKKAMEIDRTKIEAARGGAGPRGGLPGVSSYGPGGAMGGGSMGGSNQAFARPEQSPIASLAGAREQRPGTISGVGRKGMQLGKSKLGRKDFLESLKAEGEAIEDVVGAAAATAPLAPPPSEPVFLTVEEKVSVALNKDGGLEGMEVAGTMALLIGREEDACVRVILGGTPAPGYQFKTHPNIDKAMYTGENALGLKDPSRPFPAGAPLGVLKWRFQTVDESMVPLSINCWPSVSGGQSYVNIEYECTAGFDLHNVEVVVPVPGGGAPTVNQIDGQWRYDARRSLWIWTIDLLDTSNATGAAEIVVPAADAGSFFPISVSFTSPHTLCDLKVAGVVDAATGQPVKFGASTTLSTESYIVE